MQVCVWYPSKPSNHAVLQYHDYVALTASEWGPTSDSAEAAAIENYAGMMSHYGIPAKSVQEWFETGCLSIKNAESVGQEFPLIVVAQGNYQSAMDQVFLCEYIASRGYIVATAPSQTRIDGPLTDEKDVYANALAQSRDIEFIKKALGKFPEFTSRLVGLVGHSFGARSALLFAMKDPRVSALVSLDGGIGVKMGNAWMTSEKIGMSRLKTPILHFYETVDSIMTPDFELLQKFNASDRTLIKVENIHHYYFSSAGIAAAFIPGFADQADSLLVKRLQTVYESTVAFLDSYLKDTKLKKGPEADRALISKKFLPHTTE